MSADDYIDSLRVRNAPGSNATTARIRVKKTQPVPVHPKPGETGHGLTRGTRRAIVVGVFLLGTCTGGAFASAGSSQSDTPAQTVIVQPTLVVSPLTQVVQQPVPASCMKAIKQAEAILQAAATVANAGDRQLDIISKAYQGILAKDGQKLNAAATDQRKLQLELSKPEAEAIQPYQQIMDGLATCPE